MLIATLILPQDGSGGKKYATVATISAKEPVTWEAATTKELNVT